MPVKPLRLLPCLLSCLLSCLFAACQIALPALAIPPIITDTVKSTAQSAAQAAAQKTLDRVSGTTPTPTPAPAATPAPASAPAPVPAAMTTGTPAPALTGENLIKLGNYSLQTLSTGNGPYTVIFEAGLGNDLQSWNKVVPALAKSARLFLYSRAGLGQSSGESAGLNQSTEQFTQLLEAAKISPPFILVGQGYGGWLVRNYAMQHQDHVLGLVLVDPFDEKHWVELKKADAPKVAQDEQYLTSASPAVAKAELKSALKILNGGALPLATPLPDVPTVLISSTKRYERPDLFGHSQKGQEIWRDLHGQFFRQFTNGAHILTSASGPHIEQEQPELVIGAIEQVLGGVKSQAKQRASGQVRETLFATCEKAGLLLASRRNRDAEQLVSRAIRDSGLGEVEINKAGFELFDQRGQPQVAELVMKINAENYPNSDKARDNYGVILLESYKLDDAKSQFKKALALAANNGRSADVIDGYQKHLERAEQLKGKK
jgi:pimeloyl-ACP methyl ester carboxylesterase